MILSKKDENRYSRQIILKNISEEGQLKLLGAKVTIIGLGALGSAIATNLARAGIGNLQLVDRDVVELENIHRQILYDEQMVGEPKAIAAAEYLNKVNPDIVIKSIVKDVNFSTISSIVAGSQVILDGTDNLETRFLINDFAVKSGIPWVYSGVIGTQGMTMNILSGIALDLPCFRCLVPQMPGAGTLPTCDTFGILNTVPMIFGSIQSTEAIKIILGSPDINRRLLFYDVWTHEFRALEIQKNEACRCCVNHDYEYLNVQKRTIVTSLCGHDSVQITPIKSGTVNRQRSNSPATRTISSREGVIKPLSPITSTSLSRAASKISSAGTFTPRSITS